MNDKINVKDLSREQLEKIANAVLDSDSLKQLMSKSFKEASNKLIGIKEIQ